ncbi:MAG: hypothetical protein J6Y02_12780 [Pseudobutyrivibrio sp.]|nr:hypothetical protein [Pseudobutyrivibrio sp.]
MGLRYGDFKFAIGINPAIPEDAEIFIDQEPYRIHSVYYDPKTNTLRLGTMPESLDIPDGFVSIWRMR